MNFEKSFRQNFVSIIHKFIGKIHDDELGQEFTRDIGAAGVDFFTIPLNEGPVTGRSVVLVTPDAERSMFTYLGAATHLTEEDIDEEIIQAERRLRTDPTLDGRTELIRRLNMWDNGSGDINDVIDRMVAAGFYQGGTNG